MRLFLAVLYCCTALAQDRFEVASVKQAVLPPRGEGWRIFGGGPGSETPEQMTWRYAILANVLAQAFDVKLSQFNVPDWVTVYSANNDNRFDIAATLAPGTTKEQSREMVRHLLEDRFGMKWHREMQERTVYAMTVGKGGLKLSPLEESKLEGQTSQFAIQLRVQDGVGVASSGVDLKGLASLIEPYVAYEGAFVVDETGIPGKFEGSVRFADPQSLQSSTLPDFKTALEEEWGIKLEKRKAPVEIIVIDHIERLPTEN